MANPLDLGLFKHYLDFNSDDTGRIQISEPVKFDASQFKVEQAEGRYARHVTLMAEEIDLEFYEGFYEKADQPYQLPTGLVVDRVGHALEFLLEYNRRYGFNSDVKYILEKDGVEFLLGEVNFEGATTDEVTYFKCKIVQDISRALIQRKEDIEIDGFSTEDLDGNYIDPIETHNVLLKAKPVFQRSEWFVPSQQDYFTGVASPSFNHMFALNEFGVENSLSWLPLAGQEDCKVIEAVADLSNIKIEITELSLFQFTNNPPSAADIILYYRVGAEFASSTEVEVENFGNEASNETVVIDISAIANGQSLWVYFRVSNQDPLSSTQATGGRMKITAISTFIDSVVKAVRYQDLIKHSLKAINGSTALTPDFDEGGQFENLFALSGNLIRRRDDVPFYFKLKDRIDNLKVFNADLQINSDQSIVKQYDKFYDNVENGAFSTAPDESFEMMYNPRYTLNKFTWKFNTYEEDRDEQNTIESVHTEASIAINNIRVQNEKPVEIKDIYDAFSIESQRRQALKESTSLSTDDKISVIDVVSLGENQSGGFTSMLNHQWNSDDDELKILNNGSFDWRLLGFDIGGDFFILPTSVTEDGPNQGAYTVTEMEKTVITLSLVGLNQNPVSGEYFTNTAYIFDNVSLVNRTDEGFTSITGVDQGDNYANLRYTIRRNMVHWEPYISTCAEFISENPRVSYFKNNGELETSFEGGPSYKENADYNLESITPAIVTSRKYTSKIVASYDQVLDLVSKYDSEAGIGGFIRVKDSKNAMKKIYPTSIGYTWATEVLEIEGEEKKEDDVVTITSDGEIITINEVGYDSSFVTEGGYEANGEYITLFDENNVNLINFTRYDKFVINGQSFDNVTDLIQAIIDL